MYINKVIRTTKLFLRCSFAIHSVIKCFSKFDPFFEGFPKILIFNSNAFYQVLCFRKNVDPKKQTPSPGMSYNKN